MNSPTYPEGARDRLGGSSKKILFVISTMSAGGAERVASIMLNHWAASGLQTDLLTFSPIEADHYSLPQSVQRHFLNIQWASSNRLHSIYSNLQRLRMVRREIRRTSPEVVISFVDRTNILVVAALFGSGIPVIISERVDPKMYAIGHTWSLLRKLAYRWASRLVVQTESAAKWARTHTRPERISIIQNPLGPLPEPAPWVGRKKQIVSMGRMVPQKGFDVLIRAFAASRAREAGWRLVLVGDGPQRGTIEDLLQQFDIQDVAELTGIIREPANILNQSRIFVLASRFEGFPNALLEGMAMGCACVATDCPSGPADIVEDGRNGLLVPVEDVVRLTDAINRLIDNQDEAQAYASAAIAVKSKYSTDQIMNQWDDLINSVIEHRGK